MIYLLDTHTFFWTIQKSHLLSKNAKSIISDLNNKVFVSTVSFWEMSIKKNIGKLILEDIDINDFPQFARKMWFSIIDLQEEESITFHKLPIKEDHKDPFDRMLIWQAITKNMTLISRDEKFEQYKKDGLKLIW